MCLTFQMLPPVEQTVEVRFTKLVPYLGTGEHVFQQALNRCDVGQGDLDNPVKQLLATTMQTRQVCLKVMSDLLEHDFNKEGTWRQIISSFAGFAAYSQKVS